MGQVQWANGLGKEDYLRKWAGVYYRTPSHMSDNWNFAMLLLSDGSLTLMYIVSLMILVMFLCLPTHYGEIFHPGVMTCGDGMVINGEKGPEMFPETLLKGPCRFTYVLLITLQSVTLVSLHYSTFVDTACVCIIQNGKYVVLHQQLGFIPLAADFSLCTSNGTIFGKHNIFLQT